MPAVATRSMIQREIGDDRVCLLTFDRPESGANIFDAATMSELSEHVDAIERDNSVRGLIITSAKRSIFIAGADLKTLLKQAQTGELRDFIAKGQRVFNRIAGLKIPSVAAVHGACAGGGYEITLACDWRVASDDPATRRVIGKRKRAAAKMTPAKGNIPVPSDPKSAQARALGVITTATANPVDESLKLELDAIADLGKTESTQNLIRNFFLAEKYKKGSKQFEKVAHAAIIGAGVMGAGIAQWLSSRGVTVILRDVNRELLDRGLASIEKTYADAVKRGLMTEEKAKQGRA